MVQGDSRGLIREKCSGDPSPACINQKPHLPKSGAVSWLYNLPLGGWGWNISPKGCFQESVCLSASLSVGEFGKSQTHRFLPSLFQIFLSFVGVCTEEV